MSIAAALSLAAIAVSAQDERERQYREDAYSEIMAHPMKAGGGYYIREFGSGPLTPAPKGYKPVYISYYARHGARYTSGYSTIRAIMEKAHAEGKLTSLGEDFRSWFSGVYEDAFDRDGDLTEYGFRQVRGIARVMYGRFPGVFKGKTRARSLATCVPRVMLTMNSFMDELKSCDPDLDVTMDASEKYVDWLIPFDGNRKEIIRRSEVPPAARAVQEAMYEKVDRDAPMARLFNDLSWLEGQAVSRDEVTSRLWSICADAQCLEDSKGMELFTTIWPTEE